jgi:hypothetical protein
MKRKVWYGAKTIYQVITNTAEGLEQLYEERVIVLKAGRLF